MLRSYSVREGGAGLTDAVQIQKVVAATLPALCCVVLPRGKSMAGPGGTWIMVWGKRGDWKQGIDESL